MSHSTLGDPAGSSGGFLAEFLGVKGERQERPLVDCGDVEFEVAASVVTTPSYRGQRSWPGWWWSATTGGYVAYASFLEREHVMELDFDHRVVGLAARPFRLVYVDGEGRERRHAPALFARCRDGATIVTDCRSDADRDADGESGREVRDAAAFAATERACTLMNWSYRLVGWPSQVRSANLHWLAGYRQPRFAIAETMQQLEAVFSVPQPLMAGAQRSGVTATAALPVLFHLLWHHRLQVDVTLPLSESSTVSPP